MVETVSLLLCFSVFVRRSACQFSVDPDPSSSGVVGGPPLPVTTAAPSAITSTLAGPLDPGDVGTSELAITDTWTSSGPPVTDPTTPQSTTSSASSVLPPQGSTISDGDTTTSFPPSFTVTISSTSLDDPPSNRELNHKAVARLNLRIALRQADSVPEHDRLHDNAIFFLHVKRA
ncbi:hypothetical protein DFH06DRAFT_1348885 [Mycena polygramma]|nr:hypothetical protein DFH06DRAFT_1348885 [Mycena polygramma]